MNLINLMNFESASPAPEGLLGEGKAALLPMEAGSTGKQNGKAFDKTFQEQLQSETAANSLKKPGIGNASDGTTPEGEKTTGDSQPAVSREKATVSENPVQPKEKNPPRTDTAEKLKDTAAVVIAGNLSVVSGDQLLEGPGQGAVEGVAAVEGTSAQDGAGTQQLASESGEAAGNNTADTAEGSGRPSTVPPAGSGPVTDQPAMGNGAEKSRDQRPVQWTREHVSGNKLLPERVERPDVPPQAQARFARDISATETVSNALKPAGAASAQGEQVNGKALPTQLSQIESGSQSEAPVPKAGVTTPADSGSQKPEMKAAVQERIPDRPAVPAQAQARFVREGEQPARPSVPEQAQARFSREGGPSVRPAMPAPSQATSQEPSAQPASIPVKAGDTILVEKGEGIPAKPIATEQQPVRPVPGHQPASRPQVIDKPTAETPSPSQNQPRAEAQQVTERLSEIRERLPEAAKGVERNPRMNPPQQPKEVASRGEPSASTGARQVAAPEVVDFTAPGDTPEALPDRHRMHPWMRRNRYYMDKPVAQAPETTGESPSSNRDLLDPSRRAETFFTGADKAARKRDFSRDGDKADEQDNRAARTTGSQGKSLGALARPQSVQLATVNDAFLKIMSTVERITQNSLTNRVQLNIDLDGGEEMKVMLKVAKGHLHTIFMTDSDALRTAMKDGWDQFQKQMSDRGFSSSQPEFRGSGQEQDNRRQAEQSWDEQLEQAAMGVAPDKPAAVASHDLKPAPQAVDTVRHALDTYA